MSKRDPWQREPGAHDIERGGKKYRNLALYTRPCATCGTRFGIYVSQSVADGHKSNNNFGLKNCEQHRTSAVDKADATALRTANATMREELTGLYARNKAIFEELQQSKARLAVYELAPAMEAAAVEAAFTGQSTVRVFATEDGIGCEAVQNTTNSVLPFKMPWD